MMPEWTLEEDFTSYSWRLSEAVKEGQALTVKYRIEQPNGFSTRLLFFFSIYNRETGTETEVPYMSCSMGQEGHAYQLPEMFKEAANVIKQMETMVNLFDSIRYGYETKLANARLETATE